MEALINPSLTFASSNTVVKDSLSCAKQKQIIENEKNKNHLYKKTNKGEFKNVI